MKQLTSKLVRIKAFFICFVMRSFGRGWQNLTNSSQENHNIIYLETGANMKQNPIGSIHGHIPKKQSSTESI